MSSTHFFFFFDNPYFTSVLEDFFNILSPLLGPLLLLGAFVVVSFPGYGADVIVTYKKAEQPQEL